MNGREEKVCHMTHFPRKPKPRPLLQPSINEKLLIHCVSLETKPPLSRPTGRGPRQHGGHPQPRTAGPAALCPDRLQLPPSRASASARGAARRGRRPGRALCGAGPACAAVPHPGSEPTGLRSPYLRGRPVAAQRRTTVGAQPGTRLRALGHGPASLQDAGCGPRAAQVWGAWGPRVRQRPRPLLAFLRGQAAWAPSPFPSGAGLLRGRGGWRFFLSPAAGSARGAHAPPSWKREPPG